MRDDAGLTIDSLKFPLNQISHHTELRLSKLLTFCRFCCSLPSEVNIIGPLWQAGAFGVPFQTRKV